jgi:hypothetical protein
MMDRFAEPCAAFKLSAIARTGKPRRRRPGSADGQARRPSRPRLAISSYRVTAIRESDDCLDHFAKPLRFVSSAISPIVLAS